MMKIVTGPHVANRSLKLQFATAGDRAIAIIRVMAPPSLVQLVLRVALAVPFWRSGILKWSGFLQLKRHRSSVVQRRVQAAFARRPVFSSRAEVMAFMSGSVEILAPIFLVLGLATRVAALTLLAMTCVVELTVPDGWPVHITWARWRWASWRGDLVDCRWTASSPSSVASAAHRAKAGSRARDRCRAAGASLCIRPAAELSVLKIAGPGEPVAGVQR